MQCKYPDLKINSLHKVSDNAVHYCRKWSVTASLCVLNITLTLIVTITNHHNRHLTITIAIVTITIAIVTVTVQVVK